jgi:hypothetical protein
MFSKASFPAGWMLFRRYVLLHFTKEHGQLSTEQKEILQEW